MSNHKTNPEEVKPKPEKKIKFSYFEPIAGILFAIIATVVFLGFPQIIAVVFVSGPLIPTFDSDVIRSLWIPIILWAVFRIAVEVFYLIERRYTKRLALITILGNLLAFICTLIIFIPYKIVNVDYINWIHTYFDNIAAWFGEILARPNIVIIVIMFIGLVLDAVTVVRKGIKSKAKEDKDADDDVVAEEVIIDNAEADSE